MDSILILSLIIWVMGSMYFYLFHVGTINITDSMKFIGGILAIIAVLPYLKDKFVRPRRNVYKIGDHVIYRMRKWGLNPGPRAESIYPCLRGDYYSYFVRKLWTVVGVTENNEIEVVTHGGKKHLLLMTDPLLQKASFWEELKLRLLWHKKFPDLGIVTS